MTAVIILRDNPARVGITGTDKEVLGLRVGVVIGIDRGGASTGRHFLPPRNGEVNEIVDRCILHEWQEPDMHGIQSPHPKIGAVARE